MSNGPRPDPCDSPTDRHASGEGEPIDSRALLGLRGELAIRHNGKVYRLRRTRLGKLILTA
jgi:hemin uptake protein HemP